MDLNNLDLNVGGILDDYSNFSMANMPTVNSSINKKVLPNVSKLSAQVASQPIAPVASAPVSIAPTASTPVSSTPVVSAPSSAPAAQAPSDGNAAAPAGDTSAQPQDGEQVQEQVQEDTAPQEVVEEQVVEQTEEPAPEEEASNADGSTSSTENTEIPMWAKMLPLVGLGVGIYFAHKRKSGTAGYVGLGLLGIVAGSIPSTYIGIKKGLSAMGGSLASELNKTTPKKSNTAPAVVVNVGTPTATITTPITSPTSNASVEKNVSPATKSIVVEENKSGACGCNN